MKDNFHPVDLIDHDVVSKLRTLGAGFEIEYYVLDIAWKIYDAAQQSLHLTALRRGLAVSILFNVVLLAVGLAIIGGR